MHRDEEKQTCDIKIQTEACVGNIHFLRDPVTKNAVADEQQSAGAYVCLSDGGGEGEV